MKRQPPRVFAWEASDGSLFRSEAEADGKNSAIAAELIRQHAIDLVHGYARLDHGDSQDIVDLILIHYELLPRDKS